jgi:hypothetical protein
MGLLPEVEVVASRVVPEDKNKNKSIHNTILGRYM